MEIPQISIVDDDDMVRAATERLVNSLGFNARTFASAELFLQSTSLSKTQCLILDVQMPNMSGIELQDHLSQLGLKIPIIFMTAYPEESIKQRAFQAGAVCFLLKPFEATDNALSIVLSKHSKTISHWPPSYVATGIATYIETRLKSLSRWGTRLPSLPYKYSED
jgi:FixJ family two-component response regulator